VGDINIKRLTAHLDKRDKNWEGAKGEGKRTTSEHIQRRERVLKTSRGLIKKAVKERLRGKESSEGV